MNQAVKHAIEESILRGMTVHLEEATAEDVMDLMVECEGSVVSYPVDPGEGAEDDPTEIEFWGRAGGNWRVHVRLGTEEAT